MQKSNNSILLVGGAIAAYLIFVKNNPPGSGASNLTTSNAALPATTAIPTTYAVTNNTGGIANYSQLIAANSNLTNPNYVMTAAECQQYFNNYTDLQQWFQSATTQRDFKGNLDNAMNYHWHTYGCAEKRVFVPMTVQDTIQWVPPQPNPKSSGGGIFTTLLKAATVIGGAVITVASGGAAAPLVAAGESVALQAESKIGSINVLNDAELELLFTGGAILKNILPYYIKADPKLVKQIGDKLDHILIQYA